jgi:hypothetical protein
MQVLLGERARENIIEKITALRCVAHQNAHCVRDYFRYAFYRYAYADTPSSDGRRKGAT